MSARIGTLPDAVIVLAGGAGRRLGGVDKAALVVGGRTLLQAALAAAAGMRIVVVGPPRSLPAGVLSIQEDPPGGGPAAGVAAGLAALAAQAARVTRLTRTPPEETGAADGRGGDGVPDPQANRSARLVAVLAVDQPGVSAATLARLATAAASCRGGGAVLVSEGRRQYALGVFPVGALAAAVRSRQSWHGAPLRDLVDQLVAVEVPAMPNEAGDLDTPADLQRWQATDRGSGPIGPAGR